jgi:hypothetical protein
LVQKISLKTEDRSRNNEDRSSKREVGSKDELEGLQKKILLFKKITNFKYNPFCLSKRFLCFVIEF